MSMNKITQSGLSLVELLVALAIGVFLMLGISQIYLDNNKNSLYQQGQISNQESARFTLLILEQELLKAGYRRRPDDAFENTFPAATTHCGNFVAGQTVRAVNNGVCIRYQPSQPLERDCTGNIIDGTPGTPYSSSRIVTVSLRANNNELQCTSNGANIENPATGSIVSGVTELVLEYGFNATDDREITQYIANPDANDNIRSIRYSALLATDSDKLRDGIETTKQWRGENLPDDGRLYQIATSTITLRNLMP